RRHPVTAHPPAPPPCPTILVPTSAGPPLALPAPARHCREPYVQPLLQRHVADRYGAVPAEGTRYMRVTEGGSAGSAPQGVGNAERIARDPARRVELHRPDIARAIAGVATVDETRLRREAAPVLAVRGKGRQVHRHVERDDAEGPIRGDRPSDRR